MDNVKKVWDSFHEYTEEEYNKPIGKTIFVLTEIDTEDEDEERVGEYYNLEDVLNDRIGFEEIRYTIFFDTKTAPFAYEFGFVNSNGEMIATWRQGWRFQ
jgi:hypothetical protein